MIERVGVVGAGTMGAGIAQLACLGGFHTLLHDAQPAALAAGERRLREALAKGAERDLWSAAEAEAAAGRIALAPRLGDLGDRELVIEAAPEDLEVKRSLFASLAEACPAETILATNTSSLPVTAIAAVVDAPERVCGMHFFNPPALMRLVEVVATDDTDEQTVATVLEVARAMGREPVWAADEIGFIANRVNRPFSLEALRLVGDGISMYDQVDRIVRIGGAYRMGPFELMDLVGVDVNFDVARSFWEQSFGEPRWRPHPLQARMVAAGRLGRKSGRGWYDYRAGRHRPDDPEPPGRDAGRVRDPEVEGSVRVVALPTLEEATLVEIAPGPEADVSRAADHFRSMGKHVELVTGDAPGLVLGRIVAQLANEAHFAAAAGIGSPADIDTAMRLGLNHPRGPFEWTEAIGAERVLRILDALHTELGEERYRAAPSLRRAATGP